MNFDRLDLNLLRVFNAIFEERNLLRAAKRLNLSQSAVSHALARLRQTLEDDLFVRTSTGMQPTVRATAMAGPLRGALQQISSALGDEPFSPALTDREYVVAANDYLTLLLMGRLSDSFQKNAPLARLVVRPSTRIDLAGQIDLGRIDVAVGTFAEVPARFHSMRLWTQSDSLVMLHRCPIPPGRSKCRLSGTSAATRTPRTHGCGRNWRMPRGTSTPEVVGPSALRQVSLRLAS